MEIMITAVTIALAIFAGLAKVAQAMREPRPIDAGRLVELIDDRFMACTQNCAPVLANGDYTHLDYYYSDPDECQAVIEAIDQGMDNAGGYIALGDREHDDGFSTERCDCCGTRLAGSRTHFVVLGN